ncbi:TetR/AcrR family transcriptional regulator [Amycolatopsis sp. 195334CR]|uniref:TetR/AcrR family transcriptional regulator n=1 Tax=Amycolatopsis sp. 195334CR TaxID=2814588 RepID=UPI001F5DD590|nr:TetR family transcriptional regulator [Amycolatopsis sp. 195334CR]
MLLREMGQGFVRARRPEQKRQRREAILAAARELALKSGVRSVSLGNVAAAVCLAKSNVVRYFGTREEIYLELAAECWTEWGEALKARLPEVDAADKLSTAIAETLEARPLFCDLLGHSATSLEHNVSVEAAGAFKRQVKLVLGELGDAIARRPIGLTAAEGFEIAAAGTIFAAALYPAANPPSTLLEVYELDPALKAMCPPFVPTIERALFALAAGMPALR